MRLKHVAVNNKIQSMRYWFNCKTIILLCWGIHHLKTMLQNRSVQVGAQGVAHPLVLCSSTIVFFRSPRYRLILPSSSYKNTFLATKNMKYWYCGLQTSYFLVTCSYICSCKGEHSTLLILKIIQNGSVLHSVRSILTEFFLCWCAILQYIKFK
jgi:hypothetical protein